ncbi:MAG TPA: hypothetical protein VFE32_17380 [Puia sp.]|jgi:hypothetical protein|nr:hypothetical protein [Puia sp.]
MPTDTRNVVIKFTGDYSELATANQELQKSGLSAEQVKQFDELNKATAATASNVKAIATAAAGAGSQFDRLANATNNASKGIVGAAGKQALDSLRTSTAGVSTEIGKMISQLDQAKAKLASLQAGTDAFTDLEEEIKATEIAMGALAKTTASLAAGTSTIQQQTRAYTNTLVQLKQAGLDNTEVYKAVKNSLAELQISAKKVGEDIGGVASETKNLGGVVEGAEGIAGAFEAAAGASAIFGEKSEELEKTTQRVFAAMALANGIQKLYNVTLKESAAVQLIARGQAALQATATQLAAAAESEYIVVRYAATAAQAALNAVMAANPAVLLIGILVAAGAALFAFTSNTNKAAEAQKKLLEEEKLQMEALEEYQRISVQGNSERIRDLQAELTVLKAKNVSQTQILEKEKELAAAERALAGNNAGFYAAEVKNIGDVSSQISFLKEKLVSLKTELDSKKSSWFLTKWLYGERGESTINDDIDNTKAQIENLQKQLETGENSQKALIEARAADEAKAEELRKHAVEEGLKDDVAAANIRLALSKKSTEEELNAEIGVLNRKKALELNDANLTGIQRRAIEEQTAREIRDLQYNYTLEQAKGSLAIYQAYANGKLAVVQKGSNEELELEKQLLIQKRDVDTLAARDNIQEQQRVRLQFEDDYSALLRNFIRQRNLDELESAKLVNQAKLDATQRGTHEEYTLQLQAVELERQAEVAAIDERVRNTEKGQAQIAEINAKALQQEADLRKAYLQKEIEDETNSSRAVNDIRITRLQGQAASPTTTNDQRFKLQQQARQIELENIDNEEKENERLYQNKIITQEQYVQKSLELENQRLQKQYEIDNAEAAHKKQVYQAIQNTTIEITQKIADAVFAVNDNEIRQEEINRTAALDRDKEATLNQKFLTNTQKAAIDESFKRQQIASERQADIQKRNNDEQQAEIDGFLAIAKIWAEHADDPILAAVLTALAIAQTTAQLSKIKSTPLPTYRAGVEMLDGPGTSTSDSILARLSKGERVVRADINRKYFPALSAIHNELIQPEVANAMLTGDLNPALPLEDMERRGFGGAAIDYDQLGAAVARHLGGAISQLPMNEFSFDENGFVHAIRKGIERQISISKRYHRRK